MSVTWPLTFDILLIRLENLWLCRADTLTYRLRYSLNILILLLYSLSSVIMNIVIPRVFDRFRVCKRLNTTKPLRP